MRPLATASMGVCIAHYKTPLRAVLQTARNMEKKAKEVDGKNAFAIAVQKRSGEIIETTFKWFDERQTAKDGTISALKNLVNKLREAKQKQDEGFSDTFVYKLREEFNRLYGDDKIDVDDPILKTEIKRLLSRSCQMKNRTDEDKKNKKQRIDELAKDLCHIYYDSGSLNNFSSFLETAVFLARETSV